MDSALCGCVVSRSDFSDVGDDCTPCMASAANLGFSSAGKAMHALGVGYNLNLRRPPLARGSFRPFEPDIPKSRTSPKGGNMSSNDPVLALYCLSFSAFFSPSGPASAPLVTGLSHL